jgi:hypothetical protein
VGRVVLPSSAADITFQRAYFTIGRNNTAGVNSTTSLPVRLLLKDRIDKLERLVGRLTLENEFLKRRLQHSLSQVGRNGKSSGGGGTPSVVSSRDVDL